VTSTGLPGARAAVTVGPRLDQPQPVLSALDAAIGTADPAALVELNLALRPLATAPPHRATPVGREAGRTVC
jgi:hypothetical protein